MEHAQIGNNFRKKEIFRVWKTLACQHHISGYSIDVLAPHKGWRPGQLARLARLRPYIKTNPSLKLIKYYALKT